MTYKLLSKYSMKCLDFYHLKCYKCIKERMLYQWKTKLWRTTSFVMFLIISKYRWSYFFIDMYNIVGRMNLYYKTYLKVWDCVTSKISWMVKYGWTWMMMVEGNINDLLLKRNLWLLHFSTFIPWCEYYWIP